MSQIFVGATAVPIRSNYRVLHAMAVDVSAAGFLSASEWPIDPTTDAVRSTFRQFRTLASTM